MFGLEHLQGTALVNFDWIWVIAAAPLLGAVVNGFLALFSARRIFSVPPEVYSGVACAAAGVSFFAALFTFVHFKSLSENSLLTQQLFNWIEVGSFHVNMNLELDALSISLVLFITFAAGLIHVYSAGYMKGDPGLGRYFSYLNLFLFSMLVLVMAENLLVLFLGWEGVGFCSYLLIGFWFEDEAKVNAGKKAIIVNRIGDAGFVAGLLMVYAIAGTFNFNDLLAHKQLFSEAAATVICLCFFFGAAGKSAQIPLYVWLPDAMVGPTPVSALIHAATMVTAGVYLVARLHFLYVLAPWACAVVAVVGVCTALLAATLAVVQTDIKKVLAYSTISQLGFMFLGVGVGAYEAGIFHLLTHGFFKACLFLGAGSVIHILKGEQDIRKMGGLLKHVPLTSIAFLFGWLAISGLPPFAGFFSKDEILWSAVAIPNPIFSALPEILYFAGLLASFLTAFYMTRLVVMVFFGEYRGSRETFENLHESPWTMVAPLLILGAGSLASGWIGVPQSIGGGDSLGKFLEPVFQGSALKTDGIPGRMEPLLMLASLLVAVLGVGAAWYAYGLKHTLSQKFFKLVPGGKKVLEKKYYVDELYEVTVVRWVRGFGRVISDHLIEKLIVNGLVDGFLSVFQKAARWTGKIQSGLVRAYLAYMLLGAGFLLYWMVH